MADRVRGITVEIGGDTTGLSKALKGVNGEIRKTQSDLRDVERLLKLDPKNTVLLEQKQRLLADAIGGTEKKLEELKKADEQVRDNVKNYEEWKKAYDPIQDEIGQTRDALTKLKDARDKMEQAGTVDTKEYDALQDEIAETETGLKNLRKQADDVTEQFGKPISQSQYDALQREIIETENNLKSLKKQAETTGKTLGEKVADAGEKIGKIGGKIEGAGKKLLPVTAAITATGAASYAAFKEIDAGLDIVTTKTGASGDALKALHDVTKDVFGDLPVSAEEAGTAVGEVNTRFGLAEDQLRETSEEFLRFAQINETDVNNAIDSTDRILDKFNVDASEAKNVLGLMTKAGQDTGISMDTMFATLDKNGSALQELGFDLTSSINLLAQMEANGVDTTSSLAGLKKAVANAAKEGKTAKQALGETVESIKNAGTETEALEFATELFGTKGAPEMARAIRDGRLDVEDLSASLSDYGTIVGDTFENTQDAGDKAKVAMNDLKVAGSELAEAGLETLMPYIVEVLDKLKDVVDWFSSLDDGTKRLIIQIAAMVAVMGPVLVGAGKVTESLGQIVKATSKMGAVAGKVIPAIGTVFKTVFGFIVANPIALIIASIVGIIVLIALFGDQAQAILNKFTNWLKSFFVKDWTEIFGPVLGDILNGWSKNILNVIDAVHKILNGIINFIRGVFTGDWERAWRGIKDIFGGVFDGLAAMAKAPINNVIALMNGMIRVVNWAIGQINRVGFDNPFTGAHYGFNLPYLNNIPYLAKGGIIQDRGSAIVGEAGPELLTVNGNQTRVTPLTQANTTNHNTNMGGVNITIYGAPGQDVRELAEIVMEEMQYSADRKGAVFA